MPTTNTFLKWFQLLQKRVKTLVWEIKDLWKPKYQVRLFRDCSLVGEEGEEEG